MKNLVILCFWLLMLFSCLTVFFITQGNAFGATAFLFISILMFAAQMSFTAIAKLEINADDIE